MPIRPFTEIDLSAVLAIYARSKLDELQNEPRQPALIPLELDRGRYERFQASTVFVFEDEGIQGYGAHCNDEVTALFVQPEARGKGVGRALLEHLLMHTGEPCWLQVACSNTAAVALYQRYGFRMTERFVAHYNEIPVQAATLWRGLE